MIWKIKFSKWKAHNNVLPICFKWIPLNLYIQIKKTISMMMIFNRYCSPKIVEINMINKKTVSLHPTKETIKIKEELLTTTMVRENHYRTILMSLQLSLKTSLKTLNKTKILWSLPLHNSRSLNHLIYLPKAVNRTSSLEIKRILMLLIPLICLVATLWIMIRTSSLMSKFN